MKVGDMVIRKNSMTESTLVRIATQAQRERLGYGIILKKQMSGRPAHPCISVLYPKTGRVYTIAESLVEVISESR
jgi:hypothetical protein